MMILIVRFAFIRLEQKNLQSYKKICNNKGFFSIVMRFTDTKILEFNRYWKSFQTPSIIYAGLEYLIKKIDG